MAYSEEYYVNVKGERKGPYTFVQMKQLYQNRFLDGDTVYWKDGMAGWEALAELCELPAKKRFKVKKEAQITLLIAFVLIGAFAAYFAPVISEGWKEANQDQFTPEAAYWKARGFLRDELKKKNASVAFEPFDPARVTIARDATVTVSLGCTLFAADGGTTRAVWRVTLEFESRKQEWRLGSAEAITPR